MYSLALLLLSLTTITITPASALGINCRGSSECTSSAIFHFPWSYNLISSFYDALAFGNSTDIHGGAVPLHATYGSGQKIACRSNPRGVGGFCLFTQGVPERRVMRGPGGGQEMAVPAKEVDGETVVRRLGELGEHGCVLCGSVPLSGDNDPKKEGVLVSNYVLKGLCDGVC